MNQMTTADLKKKKDSTYFVFFDFQKEFDLLHIKLNFNFE